MPHGEQPEGATLERIRPVTKEPTRFRVLLHNDDYTTMEFVISVLETIFSKSPAESHRVMMHVHRSGVGVAGVYSHEVAETKVGEVQAQAKEAGYPLRATMEEE